MKSWMRFGPATLITAAFIGPGTVTVCTIAGTTSGYDLLWGIVFSVLATIILQEMAARITVATDKTLEQNLKEITPLRFVNLFLIGLVFLSIGFGNAAFETGNILGAVLGLKLLVQPLGLDGQSWMYIVFIGLVVGWYLWYNQLESIKKFMVVLVGLMSVAFLVTTVFSSPPLEKIVEGLLVPKIPSGRSLELVSIIGTTVVPYNLFLHAYIIQKQPSNDLGEIRKDLYFNIIVGGLISACIVIVSARIQGTPVNNAADLAQSLHPFFGSFAPFLIGIGLLAAGISSAVTAPLAFAMIYNGLFDSPGGLSGTSARRAGLAIFGIGLLFSFLSYKPIEAIRLAQFFNGLLLPLLAISLLYTINRRKIMKSYKNTWYNNLMAVGVILVCTVLGLKGMSVVF